MHIQKPPSANLHAEEKSPSNSVVNKSKVKCSDLLMHENGPCTCIKIVPVLVKNLETGTSREVHAFLDGGADCHLIINQLFEELDLSGSPVKGCIGLTNGSVTT